MHGRACCDFCEHGRGPAGRAPPPRRSVDSAGPGPGTDRRRRWWALAALCLGVLLVGIDNTIVNVALPTIGRELDASTSDLQWVVDGYTLVFATLLLLAGHLGDRFGRRRMLLDRPGAVRPDLGRRVDGHQHDRPHRRPGGDGGRRRADLPGHPGAAGVAVPRPQGTRRGHRHLVRRDRPLRRARSGRRRVAGRALQLVGGVPGERAAGRGRDRRDPTAGRPSPGTRSRAASTRSARSGRWPVSGCWSGRSSRPPRTAGDRPSPSAAWSGPPSCWPASSGGRCGGSIRCSTSRCSPWVVAASGAIAAAFRPVGVHPAPSRGPAGSTAPSSWSPWWPIPAPGRSWARAATGRRRRVNDTRPGRSAGTARAHRRVDELMAGLVHRPAIDAIMCRVPSRSGGTRSGRCPRCRRAVCACPPRRDRRCPRRLHPAVCIPRPCPGCAARRGGVAATCRRCTSAGSEVGSFSVPAFRVVLARGRSKAALGSHGRSG